MNVVLPAPLTPTSPKTAPRGTLRRTPSRATFAPNRRVRLLASITLSGASGWMATIVLRPPSTRDPSAWCSDRAFLPSGPNARRTDPASRLNRIGLQDLVALAQEFD